MAKNTLREKINAYLENYGSYVNVIRKKIEELTRTRKSNAVLLFDPLSVKQKAMITQTLYRRGIINRFFEARNESDNEKFEAILKEIRKVINESIESQPDLASSENSKYHRTIWLSDSAQRQYEFGVKTYQTNNLMVKSIFGISQFWYEVFTKGTYGKYVADYYRRNSAEQNYYYLPHSDRRFCVSTSSFLGDNNEIGEFLERREKHWRHLYANEIVIPDHHIEKILAYAYLNCNNATSPIYLRKPAQTFSLTLVLNLSLDGDWLNKEKLEETYNLTTVIAPPLKIVCALAKDGILCESQDDSGRQAKKTVSAASINDFLDKKEGFALFSELKKSLQEARALLVDGLRNNCFVNDHNKDNAIERFLLNTIDKIIERDVHKKIESAKHRGEIVVRLKECLRKTNSNYEYLKKSQSGLDEDVMLMDRIKRQLSEWVNKANKKQKQEEAIKRRKDASDGQTL